MTSRLTKGIVCGELRLCKFVILLFLVCMLTVLCLAPCSLRPQYYKVIEECVSQVVLHRSGMDPDFGYRERLDVDFTHLIGRSARSLCFL